MLSRHVPRRQADLPARLGRSPKFTFPAQGCWQYYSGIVGDPFMVSDRENVINLHMGIPKANGLRDDVQFMWSGSSLDNSGYTSPDDLGPGNDQFVYSQYDTLARLPTCGPDTIGPGADGQWLQQPRRQRCAGLRHLEQSDRQLRSDRVAGPSQCGGSTPLILGCAYTYMPYADNVAYNVPFGSDRQECDNIKAPGVYIAPGTPSHAFGGPIPLNDNSLNMNQNDAGITKLQYTYALSQSAYLRAYGYTFYSDWYRRIRSSARPTSRARPSPKPRSTS